MYGAGPLTEMPLLEQKFSCSVAYGNLPGPTMGCQAANLEVLAVPDEHFVLSAKYQLRRQAVAIQRGAHAL